MTQRLVLEAFPDPRIARLLSPNGGTPHWSRQRWAKQHVQQAVVDAVHQQRLHPVRGRAVLQLTFTYPQQRKRDQDNLSGGGVTKVVIDALVRLGILLGDDTAVLRQEPVQVTVEKGVRRLEVHLSEDPT